MTFDVHQLDQFLLVGSAVTLLAILAVRVSSRAGLPSLLIYLLMGVALGEAGRRDPVRGRRARPRARLRGAGADPGRGRSDHQLGRDPAVDAARASRWRPSGSRSRWPSWRSAAHYLLGLPWELAVLLGAVTSPTDAAAVFSVLRVVPLPRRLTGALEAESGLNDAPTVVLVDADLHRRGRRARAARRRRDHRLRARRRRR